MEEIASLSPETAGAVEIVLTDIDDTLTIDGRITSDAFSALWSLRREGFRIIPVTGRPAGWCDCIVRQWPVDAVVGENGAFVLFRAERTISEFVHPEVASPEHHSRLDAVRDAVLSRVEGARVAKDQPYRRYDLAIDFREDPPYLGYEVAERIAGICREMGAEAKISSIHVNTWFGAYDKKDMTLRYLEHAYGIGKEDAKLRVAFCGDSPNDEPMFSFFRLSCGVRNLMDTIHLIRDRPRYITEASHGAGFAEFAEILQKKRSKVC